MTALLKISKRRQLGSGLKEGQPNTLNIDSKEINLISSRSGLHIVQWTPSTAGFKGDSVLGESVDSPVADFEESRFARWGRIDESITLNASESSQDELASILSELDSTLRDAADFWRNEWSQELVYITVKGKDESNPRYAVLYGGRVTSSPDIYNQPFLQRDTSSVSGEFTVEIVRGHWTDQIPGESDCIPLMKRSRFDDYTEAMQNLPWVPNPEGPTDLIPLSNSLEGLWPLDDTTGSTANEVINSYHGDYDLLEVTLDQENFTDNQPAIAVDTYDGTTSYSMLVDGYAGLDTVTADTLHRRGTLSVWVKANSTIIADPDDAWVLQFHGVSGGSFANRLEFGYTNLGLYLLWNAQGDSTAYSSTQLDHEDLLLGADQDDWQNYTVIWDVRRGLDPAERKDAINLNYMALYVNGTKVGELRGIPPWENVDGGRMRLDGSLYSGFTGPFYFSHIMLFDRALSPGEIGHIVDPQFFEDRESCEPVFINNRFGSEIINYVYHYDDSTTTFTNESSQSLPFKLFPDPIAVDDILYVGAQQNRFSNIVFNLEPGTGARVTWEYWNGSAWAALPNVVDSTENFRADGVNAVAWTMPADWVTNDPGMGVTAFWVRAVVGSVNVLSDNVVSEQANDIIVTASGPYVDTAEDGSGGDVPALAALRADFFGPLEVNQVIIGKRRLDRGRAFNAYLNASKTKLPPGVTTNGGLDSSFTSDITEPGFGYYRFDPVTEGTFQPRVSWKIGEAVAGEYYGLYRAIVRVRYGSAVNTGSVHLRMRYHTTIGFIVSFPTVTPDPDSIVGESVQYVDMGLFSMPPPGSGQVNIAISAVTDGGTVANWYVDFITLYLIPADEWIAEASSRIQGQTFGDDSTLLINSTHENNLHGRTRARLVDQSTIYFGRGMVSDYAAFSTTGKVEVSHNKQERYWFFFRGEPLNDEADPEFQAIYRISMDGEKRFLGLRGNR